MFNETSTPDIALEAPASRRHINMAKNANAAFM
jgi:hypothetical protein